MAMDKSGILRSFTRSLYFGNDMFYYEKDTVSREIICRIAYPRDFPSRFVILANINTWRWLERLSLLAKDQKGDLTSKAYDLLQ